MGWRTGRSAEIWRWIYITATDEFPGSYLGPTPDVIEYN